MSKDYTFLANVIATRVATQSTKPSIPKLTYRGQENRLPSLDTGIGNATAKAAKVYTGTAMKGIAQMHKSNACPVFSDEEIVNIAHMRR